MFGGVPLVSVTAFDNLFNRARLRDGESVLVHGGGSGVGTMAVQLARRARCQVLVTAGADWKVERCVELGADEGWNYRQGDFVPWVHEVTGGRGVDVILDCVGASYLRRNLDALADDGRLAVIGFMGGDFEAAIDMKQLLFRRLTVTSASIGNRPLAQKREVVEQVGREVIPAFEHAQVVPVIDRVYGLEHAAEAHRRLETGEHFGKVLLRCADEGTGA